MKMGKYLLHRIPQMFLVLLFASISVFSLLQFAPGDPILALRNPLMTKVEVDQLYVRYGLDQPLYIQYFLWIGMVLQGDFGDSIRTNQPVSVLIFRRFTNTLALAGLSMTIAACLGIFAGVISATRRGSVLDLSSMTIAILGFSIPPFWLGILLIILFSVMLKWLPAGGVGSFANLILPSISLGTSAAAIIARMTRSAMLDVLNMNYIIMARAKGLSENRIVFIHGFKNAVIPVLTILGQMAGAIMAGAVVTETVFNYPGIGLTLVKSLAERDYPIIQAALLVTSGCYILISLIIDIAYTIVDPRIRYD